MVKYNDTDTYGYDHRGYRTQKTLTEGAQTTTINYYNDIDGNVMAEVDSAGNSKQYFGGRLPMALKANGSYYYYIYNWHGDVVRLLNADGSVANTYDYDVWGGALTAEEQVANPIRYTGSYYDEETGYYYLKARYYDPCVGRFISKDPHWNLENMIFGDNPKKVGENLIPDYGAMIQSSNLYAYSVNNPLALEDPDGEVLPVLAIILGGAFLGALIGGVSSAITQKVLTGKIDGRIVALDAGIGAITGAMDFGGSAALAQTTGRLAAVARVAAKPVVYSGVLGGASYLTEKRITD